MGAKNKRTRHAPPAPAPRPDLQQLFTLHYQASLRRDELLEEARSLQAAGKIRQARAVLKQAEHIQKQLAALVHEIRLGQ